MTTDSAPSSPSSDERVMAALSHISVILPPIGIVAPIVIWVTQKDKSRYVYAQSLQAILYNFMLIIGWMLGMGCYMASFFLNILTVPMMDNATPTPWIFGSFFLPFAVLGLLLMGWFIFIIYACVAAVATFQGKDFRYLVIGKLVDQIMQK